jgi:hypothetical protein
MCVCVAASPPGQTPTRSQQPGKAVGTQVNDQVIARPAQLSEQGKGAAPALLLVTQGQFSAPGAVLEQFDRARVCHNIHSCPRILCVQGLHDRCRHDGITDIAECDQQDSVNSVTGLNGACGISLRSVIQIQQRLAE